VRIAFVVQRYGPEILGGAEQMCRLIAERLAEQHQIDVLTSCAKDFFTWKNEYPEGADRLRGVTVRRFACSQTRDIEAFGKYSAWIFSNPHGPQDEQEWLKRQGPWSPGLMDYVERHHSNYDILVLFTYLYAPTVMAARIAPAKTVLVPFAHDEPAIKLDIFRELFTRVGGIAWNTESERRFANSLFDLRPIVEDVIGCGVDLPEGEAVAEGVEKPAPPPDAREPLPPHLDGAANAFRRRHRIYNPFVLFGGRIDPAKGCEELFEYFQTYVKEGGDATLMLMGAKMMPLPDDPHVKFAGLLPEEERLHALEAATVVVVPSPYESLSLLALESFAVGTPVLANARSEVLVEHCRRSHAGLFYANRWEFVEALKLLIKDARLRAEMGRNGKAYVNQHYRWNTVLAKYERLFSRLRGGAREQDAGARSQGTPVHHGAPARHPNRPTHPRGPSRHQRRR
jgi:glycosyltransferase involved in cell wall biosynthesis